MLNEMGGPDDRRAFLAKAGKVAITAPAAALLLSASGRSAMATPYGKRDHDHDHHHGHERETLLQELIDLLLRRR